MTSRLREKSQLKLESFTKRYEVIGRIGEGAYGVVRLAYDKESNQKVAMKSLKPNLTQREGEGIPISVCREINLLRELDHENILKVREVIFEPNDRSLIMICNYCKLDLEKLLKYHNKAIQTQVFDKPFDIGIYYSQLQQYHAASNTVSAHGKDSPTSASLQRSNLVKPQLPLSNKRAPLPHRLDQPVVKSILWQILRGIEYLHANWIIHRDLKPANILLNDDDGEYGTVKVADFGLARIFKDPIQKLSDDGPVVTIWYRAPEILLGSKHYTPAIDMWAVGCIFNELVTGKALFDGKEVKNPHNQNPFQKYQVECIFKILGTPTVDIWPTLTELPEYHHIQNSQKYHSQLHGYTKLDPKKSAFDLLKRLLTYDPQQRITAREALKHPFFDEQPQPSLHCFGRERTFIYPEHSITDEKKLQQQQQQQQQQSQVPGSLSQVGPNKVEQLESGVVAPAVSTTEPQMHQAQQPAHLQQQQIPLQPASVSAPSSAYPPSSAAPHVTHTSKHQQQPPAMPSLSQQGRGSSSATTTGRKRQAPSGSGDQTTKRKK